MVIARLCLVCVALVGLIGVTGCAKGSGVPLTRERELSTFQFLNASYPATYKVLVGKDPKVEITADDNLVDQLDTFVSGDTLYVASKSKMTPGVEVTIRITVPELHGVTTSTRSVVSIKRIQAERFEIKATHKDAIVIAKGKVGELSIEAIGTPSVDASELEAKDAEVMISGDAIVDVNVEGTLDAIMKKGTLRYVTQPLHFEPKLSDGALTEYVTLAELEQLRLDPNAATASSSAVTSSSTGPFDDDPFAIDTRKKKKKKKKSTKKPKKKSKPADDDFDDFGDGDEDDAPGDDFEDASGDEESSSDEDDFEDASGDDDDF